MLKFLYYYNISLFTFIFVEINFTNMEDNFDDFAVPIESDVLSQDFDDVDLYGDKYEEEESDEYGDDIQFD